jgi:hypothetical protein
MAAFLIQLKGWGVPGFRSGNPIKGVLAGVGYAVILIWVLGGHNGKPGLSVFGLAVLAVVLLVSNAWNVRSRVPLLSSPHRFSAAAGWGIVAVLFASTLAWAGAETPAPSNATSLRSGTGGVGGGAPATAKPEAIGLASPAATPTLTPTAAATPTATPTPTPTPKPATPAPVVATAKPPPAPPTQPPAPPVANTCGAPANPWGYNFCGGNVISSPPSSFCSYFSCISSFWKSTNGYVEQCADGMFSHSGGRQGSCSYHGGNQRPLYGP